MPVVRLGNPQVIHHSTGVALDIPDAVTMCHLDDDKPLVTQVRDIVHNDGGANTGLWVRHSSAAAPSWVESTSPELAQALADHYGCPIGEPNADTPKG